MEKENFFLFLFILSLIFLVFLGWAYYHDTSILEGRVEDKDETIINLRVAWSNCYINLTSQMLQNETNQGYIRVLEDNIQNFLLDDEELDVFKEKGRAFANARSYVWCNETTRSDSSCYNCVNYSNDFYYEFKGEYEVYRVIGSPRNISNLRHQFNVVCLSFGCLPFEPITGRFARSYQDKYYKWEYLR